jgi:hypothetical protein
MRIGIIPWGMMTVEEAAVIYLKGGTVRADGDRKAVIVTYPS